MTDEPVKNKRITIGKVILLLLIAIFVFIMFPRRYSMKDGGTVYYGSWPAYIRIFENVVYEDTYVDYDHPEPTGHSPEYYEASRQIESALGNTKSESESSSTSNSSESSN